jgi:hypothetical protein
MTVEIIFVDNYTKEDLANNKDTFFIYHRDFFDVRDDLLGGYEICSQIFCETDREDMVSDLQTLNNFYLNHYTKVVIKTKKKGKTIEECFVKPQDLPTITNDQIIDLILMRLKLLDPIFEKENTLDYVITIELLCEEYISRFWPHITELGSVVMALETIMSQYKSYTLEQYEQAEKIIREGGENTLIELQKIGFDFEVRWSK